MRFHKADQHDKTIRLPMTSLIDVVFLLLIYFMVTASFNARENRLASALQSDQEGSGRASDLQPQILSVSMEGELVVYRIGERMFTSRGPLVETLSRLHKDTGVFVKVSNGAPVEAAAIAIQSCKDAGFRKVTYVPAR